MQSELKLTIIAASALFLLSCHSDVPDLPEFSAVQKHCKITESLCKNLYANDISEETCTNVLGGTVVNSKAACDGSSSEPEFCAYNLGGSNTLCEALSDLGGECPASGRLVSICDTKYCKILNEESNEYECEPYDKSKGECESEEGGTFVEHGTKSECEK